MTSLKCATQQFKRVQQDSKEETRSRRSLRGIASGELEESVFDAKPSEILLLRQTQKLTFKVIII